MNNQIDGRTLKCLSDLGLILKEVAETQASIAKIIGSVADEALTSERRRILSQAERTEIQLDLFNKKVEKLRTSLL